MRNTKTLFTAGQFAKIHNINKRTLHYYDDIGLFSPSHKGENGYRYYTYLQSATLEMLLTLRELDMSTQEIDSYMKNRSAQLFHKVIAEKSEEIEHRIGRLKEIRQLLANKESQLCICEQTDLDSIEVVELDEEYLLLSRSITGTYDESDFAVLVEHLQGLRAHRMFNKSYGSILSAEHIIADSFDEYDCFFTKVDRASASPDLFIKPAGRYIKAFCKGSWDRLPAVYRRILNFAKDQGLTLNGFAYEEGMNEMAISEMEDYVTMIVVSC